MNTKLPTTIDLIEAGARCSQGRCLTKTEDNKTQEELIQQIEIKIKKFQEQERPGRLKMVHEFADHHKIEGDALIELTAWICDYQNPHGRRNQ